MTLPTTWGFAMCRFPQSQITCNQISDYSAARNDQPVSSWSCGLCPSGLCPSNRKQQEIYRTRTRKLNNENRSFQLTCAELLHSISRARVNLAALLQGPCVLAVSQLMNLQRAYTEQSPQFGVRSNNIFSLQECFRYLQFITVITAWVIRCRYTNWIHSASFIRKSNFGAGAERCSFAIWGWKHS